MMEELPMITVITAVLNQVDALKETMRSVLSQDYHNIEYIVIDGASTDGTVSVLESSSGVRWLSEPDEGISDAFNKGIKMARGDYIYFIGAGDYFWSDSAISKMISGVNPEIDTLVCGRIARPTEKGARIVPYEYNPVFNKTSLRYKMPLPHQGLFTHRRFFDQFGLFDTNLRYAMDYEILLRAHHDFPRTVMKEEVVAAWLAGGIGADCTEAVYAEYRRIKERHKICPTWMLSCIHYWNTFKYRIKSVLLPAI